MSSAPGRHTGSVWRTPSWLWLALAAAVIVRVAWLADKPLWRDEAWVASLARDPVRVFDRPMRPVPVGFLGLSALALRVPALPAEVTLRLVPLAAGLATVVLLPVLARALGARAGTATAVAWLAAGMPALVYYSRELKPYALDALAAVAVPWLAWRVFAADERRFAGTRPEVVLAAVLVLAPWLTFGTVFVIGATLGWGAWRAWRADARTRLRWARVTLAYALSFGAAYALVLRNQSSHPRLRQYARRDVMQMQQGAWPTTFARATSRYAETALPYAFPGVAVPAAALVVAGALSWPRPSRALVLWQSAGTAGLTAVAAALGQYVVTRSRLLLFAAPALALLAAGGLAFTAETLARWTRRPSASGWAAAAAAAVALAWSADVLTRRVAPEPGVPTYFRYDVLQDVDAVIAEAARRAAPSEPVITSRYSGEQFRFYARGRLPQTFVCTRTNCRDEGPPMRAWFDGVTDRGWMILLAEEDRPWRREAVVRSGFELREVAAARGARLWEIRRVAAATP
jgi:hypothetical protein